METLEAWQKAWREGIAPQLKVCEMEVLKLALARQSMELCQGGTVLSSPTETRFGGSKPYKACGVAFMGWKGRRLGTVALVCDYFREIAAGCERLMGKSHFWHFTKWFDLSPLSEVADKLIPEIDRSLALLKSALVAPAARPE